MKLEIKDLHVSVEGKEILKGFSLTMNTGEIHAIMGPNGAGKSTLSYALLGHPKYQITRGEVLVDGKDILALPANERAKTIFLAFQYPMEIPGVNYQHFLYSISRAQGKQFNAKEFLSQLKENLKFLGLPESFAQRQLNVGFSGGEKKRMEILQLMTLKPAFAILDEADSGLDIDSIKVVAKAVNAMRNKDFGALIITHYKRILEYVKPDKVHIVQDGRIVQSGDASLAAELEKTGYQPVEAV